MYPKKARGRSLTHPNPTLCSKCWEVRANGKYLGPKGSAIINANAPHKSHKPSHKNPAPRIRIVGQGSPRDSQNNTGCGCCPWLSPRGWRQVPIAEDTMNFRHRTWKIRSVSEFLPAWGLGCRISKSAMAACEEGGNQSCPAGTPRNHNNGQHVKGFLRVQRWLSSLAATNSCLLRPKACSSEWKSDLVLGDLSD